MISNFFPKISEFFISNMDELSFFFVIFKIASLFFEPIAKLNISMFLLFEKIFLFKINFLIGSKRVYLYIFVYFFH